VSLTREKNVRLTLGLAVLSCLLSTGLLAHADVSGTWTGAKFTLELNAAGDKLSGVVTETGMEPRRFSDGRLDGSRFVFATIVRLNGQDVALEGAAKLRATH
jgi:hypothetical protein